MPLLSNSGADSNLPEWEIDLIVRSFIATEYVNCKYHFWYFAKTKPHMRNGLGVLNPFTTVWNLRTRPDWRLSYGDGQFLDKDKPLLLHRDQSELTRKCQEISFVLNELGLTCSPALDDEDYSNHPVSENLRRMVIAIVRQDVATFCNGTGLFYDPTETEDVFRWRIVADALRSRLEEGLTTETLIENTVGILKTSVPSSSSHKCSVEECTKPVLARGLCDTHVQRLWRTGDIQAEKPIKAHVAGGQPCKTPGCPNLTVEERGSYTSRGALGYCRLCYRRTRRAAHASEAKAQMAENLRPTMDNDELERRVRHLLSRGKLPQPMGNSHPSQLKKVRVLYEREPCVKAWVLQEAKGRCELCGQLGPFKLPTGQYFLEVHHVLSLAEGGPDIVENTVALCPSCHRRLHLSVDAEEQREKLYAIVDRLRR